MKPCSRLQNSFISHNKLGLLNQALKYCLIWNSVLGFQVIFFFLQINPKTMLAWVMLRMMYIPLLWAKSSANCACEGCVYRGKVERPHTRSS